MNNAQQTARVGLFFLLGLALIWVTFETLSDGKVFKDRGYTLIAGFVVPAGASKRVLVRAVGPGLTPFGVTGVLAQSILQLQSGSTVVAHNTNWTTSADRDAIMAGLVHGTKRVEVAQEAERLLLED